MQLISSLHILLTCSFVLLFAYLLSTVLSYLASSLIHGTSARARPREGSTRGLRSKRSPAPTIHREIQEELRAQPLMDRLQEEDEEGEEESYAGAYSTRAAPTPSPAGAGFEIAESIFQERISEHGDYMEREECSTLVDARDEHYDAADMQNVVDNGERNEEAEDQRSYVSELSHQNKGIDEIAALVLERKEGQGPSDGNGNSSNGKLGDPQGNSSQRLPPTWSDLERIVNLSSKKISTPAASAPPLDEAPLSDEEY